MTTCNGYDNHRLDVVEADQRDLRQMMLEEFRALRGELKHIKEIGQHNAKALDLVLLRMKAEDEQEDGNG